MVAHIKGRHHLCGTVITYLGLSLLRNCHKSSTSQSQREFKPIESSESEIPKKVASKGKAFRKGLKGITFKARNQIKDACIILERMFGTNNLSFLTVTLPTLPPADHIKIISMWSEVRRRYMEKLRTLINKRKGSALFITVTELQEERGSRENHVYPHLHITFPGRGSRYSKWIITKGEARELWRQTLKSVLKYSPDCSAATRIEQVKYSVEGYLAKYMSKGGKTLQQIKDKGMEEYIPHSWVYMSDDLREAANNSVEKFEDKVSEFIFDNHEFLVKIGVLTWSKAVEITITDHSTNFEMIRKVAVVANFDRSKPREKHLALIESMIKHDQ